jgi:hypothetical protein
VAIVVRNASREMTWEQVQGHVPAIKGHFEKLAKRFPTDLTVQSLLDHVLAGRRDLWLILDGETLLATACTAIETIDATGIRILRLMDLAGKDIPAWAEPLELAMEAFGKEQNVDYRAVEGRGGWSKVMKHLGYREHARLWRKKAA